jgi:serine/threonine protein kinase/regulator of sirC expression with transglutaminase-like and TPR domain
MTERDDTAQGGRGVTAAMVTSAPKRAQFEALKSGLMIRQYIIEEVIGAGGFGITYRARHERLAAKVFALKEYFPREFAAREGTQVVSTESGEDIFRWGLDRFLKEAEALAKCHHPGIVDVVDYFEENGTAYAVLGYIEGQQMGQWLQGLGRPPTQEELDRLVVPLLDALEVVHGAKLLHRDIAPDNILIRRDGAPCLIDFGACREDVRERSVKVSAIVKHGYSPPEQYHGLAELQGPWTDIYAVGATLYRAISGQPPMDSSRRGSLGDGLKPMAEMATVAYRPAFLKAIDASLRLKPEMRPQSVGDWRKMLMQKETSPPPPPPPPPPPEPVVRSRTPLLIAGAVALVLAGIGMVAALRPPGPDPRDQQAEGAWSRIAATADRAAIERFLAEHGGARVAAEARRRLAQVIDAEQKAARDRAERERIAKETREREEAAARRAEEARRTERERAARSAWERISSSNDAGAIERFLAEHATSSLGETARARLAALALAAGQVRDRDAQWRACQEAAEAERITACTPVIDGDDTVTRRASAHHLRGVARRKAGQQDQAIEDLTRSLALVPSRAEVLNDRGIAHALKSDRQAAVRDFSEVIRLEPRHAEALNNRAWVRHQMGETQAALADANQSVAIDATKAYAFDTRGTILESLGRRDEAIRDYQRAQAIDPNDASSRAALQRLGVRRP